ncbi:klarsicht protein isoform X3 [Eupeodes corollae]|uniref:klarsicht protein isoform X3 n=1 Tax=Eupeodes corollae TaxID=290404 RepID=UPI002490D8E9|nr:klarsicht protein isoform X3 [Eupeodes corollae]
MKAPATVINTNNNTNSTTSSNGGDESFCSSSNTNFMPISSVSEINNSTMDNTHHHHQQQQHPQPQQQQTPSFGSNNISTSNSGSGGLLMHHQTSASGSGTGDGPGASRINGVNITNNGNSNSGGGSYIKASLSMTSLPPDEQQEGREVIKAKLRVERPYNSLKKKRNTDRDTWRHSWGSGHSHSSCSLHSNATTGGIIGLVSGKDEFWAALQTNYNYIMDTNLLDTCKEARCEIEGAASITKNATENCLKMLDTSRSEGSSEDPKELRKWLREMESKLEEAPTLSEATQFGIEELQRRLDEHSVLYREIVSHARVVGACIKASEKKNNLASDEQQQQQNSSLSSTDEKSAGVGTGSAAGADTRGASDLVTGGKTPSPNSKETSSKQKSSNNEGNLKGLEHRYHLLYLKAIEVQCLFEGLLGKKISAANLLRSGGATTSEETDEEPASKLARLSDSESDDSTHSAEEHRVALRTTAECCKKAAKKSNCNKISKSAEPSSDDDEGWLYTNSAEHCIDGSHRQTKIVVNQEKSHHHHQHQHQHHHHSKANNSSSQLSTNDDSDKENKTGTAVTSILANNANSGGSSSNSNSNQTTPSIRSSSSLNSSSQIAITEIQLNGGGGSSNYSGSTTGSFIGCAATSTTVVMHRSVMELQLGSNNSISQGSSTNITSRSPNRSVQSNEHQFVDPTTPTKCYYSNFETNPVFNGRNVSPRTPKKSGNTVTTATFEVSSAKEVSHESIKQLVLGAEHLVRDDAMKTPTKQNQQQQKHSIVKISSTIKKREVIMPGPAKQRIEEWLEHQPVCIKQEPQVSSVPTTDCEASGEASETDSVARGSDSSEGFTDSVATCMQTTGGSNSYGNSIEHIGGSAEPIPTVGSNQSLNATSKVLRRQNRRKNDRPWSVSCLSQLTEANAQIGSKAQASQAGLATHSISESALDSLSPGRQRNDSQPNISVKNTESKNSLKRRKIRKKKQLAKKNESGSDGMLQIKKTESLSSGQTVQEITAALLNLPKSNLEAGEEQTLMKPNFRVGSYTTAYMTNENKLGSLAALATYMNEEDPQGAATPVPSVREYTTGTEDHHSSFSETAWDNYQEKYNSENYSEGFDSDAARRLLEFGDDYRNFLDSQSDCCSSLSAANNLDSMSPPQMDSLKQNEAKVVIQETIVSSVDHARRRRALELEYERRRKNLEVRRKSCQDDIIQNIRSPTTSLSSSANALTPKNNEKFSFMARVDSATRKLDFGMSHSAQSLRRTSESDTSSRRRRADDRRRSSRNLEKSIKLIPATSSSSEEHTDDEKEMRNLLTQSKNRLEDTRSLKIRSHLLRPEDYAEIIATCRDNIRCLDSVLRGPPGTVMSAGCLNATKDLLSSWEELLAWSENAAAARKMQEEMIILKSSLNRLGGKLACDLDTEPSIQLSIEALKNEKSQLQTYRTNMLRLNASVHSWLTRQERKLAAELAEHEEAIKSATEATLQSSQTQQVPETSSGSNNENVTVDNSNKKSVGTIAFDQDKHSQITTIIQSESEFHKHLKNEVSEMYSAWDEANSRINNQLEVLTTSLIAWRQLESGLYEFQQVLGKDRGTLKGLEGALDKGKTTPVELAQNVKLVAKLLSEKVEVSQEQLTAVQEHLDPSRILHIAQFTASNGSLSDSGISDGATSDGGLSERERRLGVLRRLAKQLESALAPGSEAMKSIAARMESAEFDLKSLQNTCRDLIVRTAASHTKKSVQNGSGGDDRPPSKKNSPESSPSSKRRNKRNKKSAAIAAANLGESDAAAYNVALATSPDAGDPDDPYNEESLDFDSSDDENKTGKPGWVKRIAKIAFPMQVALFTLICAACMMQPNCCDNLNNLSMSFTPQLRYIRGPPPI